MNPQIFLVGGAVRDHVLGFNCKDRDYVVVGATHDWMIEQGFKQVGAAFPVYLHPTTGEEYALARKERKVAPGYKGFVTTHTPDVRLEDDLMRRDLTINSMAMDDNGKIFDPFNGMQDIKENVLRHTSIAFAEDPLRVLRLARFAARYKTFEVAPETVELSRELVQHGELTAIAPDRIWTELMKGFSENNAIKFLDTLRITTAIAAEPLSKFFLPMDFESVVRQLKDLRDREIQIPDVDVLVSMIGLQILDSEELDALRVPSHFKVMGELFHSFRMTLLKENVTHQEFFELIMRHRLDATQGKEYVASSSMAAFILAGELGVRRFFTTNYQKANRAVEALRQIDFAKLVETTPRPEIKAKVAETRLAAIKAALK